MKKCLNCKSIFLKHPRNSLKEWLARKYCSKRCSNFSRSTKIQKNCLLCKRLFVIKPSTIQRGNGKYCSLNCYNSVRCVVKIIKKCPTCKKNIIVSQKRANRYIYCSVKCRNGKVKRVCRFCKKEFIVFRSDTSIHCSIKCRLNSVVITRKCKMCNRVFSAPRYCINNFFCSYICSLASRRGENHPSWTGKNLLKQCLICDSKFEVRVCRSKQQYCSKKCNYIARIGRNAGTKCYNWQGGKTTLQMKIRNSYLYKIWRTTVFQRDNFICQACGIRGGKLHADHIIPFSFLLKKYNITTWEKAVSCLKLWDITNGQTLCVPCHQLTETYMMKALGYTEDIAPQHKFPLDNSSKI